MRGRDEKYKKDRLQLWRRIFGNATSEVLRVSDFVAQFMATSSASSFSAAVRIAQVIPVFRSSFTACRGGGKSRYVVQRAQLEDEEDLELIAIPPDRVTDR